MKNEVLNMKKTIILVFIAVFSYWILNNFEIIIRIFSKIINVLLPFILGGIIAFILNIPMSKIEKKLKTKIKNKDGSIRVISIILSLLIFIAIIVFISFLLIPELFENIKMLINSIPSLIDKLETFVINLLDKYPDIQSQIKSIFSNKDNITEIASSVLNHLISGTTSFISSFVSSFITIFTAIIFSIYMLGQKENLIRGTKKIIYAITTKKRAEKIIEVGSMINNTFSKFLSGQCLEAGILGCLMFVALTIFRFPYALLISVLTAVTALIPYFGALIAMIVGIILIAITDPIKAILFVVVFLVVQQIEGNFIYPKVVGKSVGLSPLWTLLTISVGGNLFGIIGMLLGLPLASIIYSLIKKTINDKLLEKQMNIV